MMYMYKLQTHQMLIIICDVFSRYEPIQTIPAGCVCVKPVDYYSTVLLRMHSHLERSAYCKPRLCDDHVQRPRCSSVYVFFMH